MGLGRRLASLTWTIESTKVIESLAAADQAWDPLIPLRIEGPTKALILRGEQTFVCTYIYFIRSRWPRFNSHSPRRLCFLEAVRSAAKNLRRRRCQLVKDFLSELGWRVVERCVSGRKGLLTATIMYHGSWAGHIFLRTHRLPR